MHVEGMHTHKLAPRGGIPHTARQKCEHRKRLQEGKCSQPKKLSHCALLNVCISFNNANMERVQAPQQIGTLECQSMKRQSPLGEPQQSLKLHVHRMERGFAYKCLPQRALPTLPLMCYRAETAKNWMSTTLQMTQGQSSGKPDNQLVSRTTFRTNGKPPPSNMIITSREPTNPANGTRPNLQVDPVGSSFLSHHPWQKMPIRQNRPKGLQHDSCATENFFLSHTTTDARPWKEATTITQTPQTVKKSSHSKHLPRRASLHLPLMCTLPSNVITSHESTNPANGPRPIFGWWTRQAAPFYHTTPRTKDGASLRLPLMCY
jgi:hypothetical protein